MFCDDIPRYENELYLSLVTSTRARAKILSIDTKEALACPGVHAFYSAEDLTPDQNVYGLAQDEHLFAPGEVSTHQSSVKGNNSPMWGGASHPPVRSKYSSEFCKG